MKLSKIMCALALGAALLSCEKNDKLEPITILGETSYTIPKEGKTFEVKVETTADLLRCSVVEGEKWLEANYNNGIVKIRVYKNVLLSERSCTIKLSAKGYKAATIAITQEAPEEIADPFNPSEIGKDPNNYFAFQWDNSWTIENWIYRYDGTHHQAYNENLKNTIKFEAYQYFQNGITESNWANHDNKYRVEKEYTIAILFNEDFLKVFGGKPIRQFGIGTFGDAEACSFDIIRVKPAEDPEGVPSWRKGKCYDQEGEPLYSFDASTLDNGYGYTEWYNHNNDEETTKQQPSLHDSSIQLPTSGELMLVAKLTSKTNTLCLLNQPDNKFARAFANNVAASNYGMFPVSGGYPEFNFIVDEQ